MSGYWVMLKHLLDDTNIWGSCWSVAPSPTEKPQALYSQKGLS